MQSNTIRATPKLEKRKTNLKQKTISVKLNSSYLILIS